MPSRRRWPAKASLLTTSITRWRACRTPCRCAHSVPGCGVQSSINRAFKDYQDIDNALREGISNISAHGDSVDEDELETELREILAEDKYKGEKEGEGGTVGPSQVRLGKRILEISDLPDVPTRSLASTTPKGKGVDLEERWKRLRTGVAE